MSNVAQVCYAAPTYEPNCKVFNPFPQEKGFSNLEKELLDLQQLEIQKERAQEIRDLSGHSKIAFDEIKKSFTTILPIYMAQSTGKVARVSGKAEGLTNLAIDGFTHFITVPGVGTIGTLAQALVTKHFDKAHQERAQNVYKVFHTDRIGQVADQLSYDFVKYFSHHLPELTQKSVRELGAQLAYTAIFLVKDGGLPEFIEANHVYEDREAEQVQKITDYLFKNVIEMWNSELDNKTSKGILKKMPAYDTEASSKLARLEGSTIKAPVLLRYAKMEQTKEQLTPSPKRIPSPEAPVSQKLNSWEANGAPPLMNALAKPDASGAVAHLLTLGADPNVFNDQGEASLHVIASQGQTPLVDLLVSHGANLELLNRQGQTPLFVALRSGNEDTANELLAYHANPKFINPMTGESLLHPAAAQCSLPLLKKLIAQGLPVENVDQNGLTVLHKAVQAGRPEIVKFLIEEKQANVLTRDKLGSSLLRTAQASGNQEMIEYLDRHFSENLGEAVKKENLEQVKTLLDYGVNLNRINKTGLTPLAWASKKNYLAITKAILETDRANLEVPDQLGLTALYHAAFQGNKAIVELLLNKGAKVNIRDKSNGQTIFQKAIEGGNEGVAELLLAHGASIGPEDYQDAVANGMDELAKKIKLQKAF